MHGTVVGGHRHRRRRRCTLSACRGMLFMACTSSTRQSATARCTISEGVDRADTKASVRVGQGRGGKGAGKGGGG